MLLGAGAPPANRTLRLRFVLISARTGVQPGRVGKRQRSA